MKAVILAGGLGTRLSEETDLKPKPMIEIGGRPILWHIMKIYAAHGITNFIICCGYKGYLIKEYFANYFLHNSDISIDLKNNEIDILNKKSEPWRITLVDTGETTMTGGRIKRIDEYLNKEDPFFMTYGDGLANVDIMKQLDFHRNHKKLATVLAVQPAGRFGSLVTSGDQVVTFDEKPKGDRGWINGGFFILNKEVLQYIADDSTIWESDTLPLLTEMNELQAFYHDGFWQPMDTIRDKRFLQNIWQEDKAEWKIW